MIKGAQKQMIVIRTGDSRYFDEAYFVLRREIKPPRPGRNDMLTEANRILEEHAPTVYSPAKKRVPRGILFFLSGILCGGGVAVLLCLLLI